MTGGHLTSISLSLRLSLSLLFQHFVFVLGTIEDILFVVDSVVLLGFDMATIGFGLLNACIHTFVHSLCFYISEVMLQAVVLLLVLLLLLLFMLNVWP